jgi:hypothetical protein
LRLAIVGRIKAGKSTLMNAVLGEDLVPTGPAELTFTVNEFRHSDSRTCSIVKKDGSDESWPMERLLEVVGRDDSRMELLKSIERVQIGLPSTILKSLIILDTPGLGSVYEEDAKNTLVALGLTAEAIDRRTLAATGRANALLYLFKNAPGGEEIAQLSAFRKGEARLNAVHSMAVFSQVDDRFPEVRDPFESALKSAHMIMRNDVMRDSFFTLLPISGRMGLGAQLLTSEDFGTLFELSKLDPKELNAKVWLRTEINFKTREHPIAGMPMAADRARVANKLGYYGCYFAVETIRSGATPEQVSAELVRKSGIEELRRILLCHFSGRATAITTLTGLEEARRLCLRSRRLLGDGDLEVLSAVETQIAEFLAKATSLRELRLLREIYDGTIQFDSAETTRMLEVVGERGLRTFERLGLETKTDALRERAMARERSDYFHRVACFASRDRTTRDAAAVLSVLYSALAAKIEGSE